MVALVAWIPRQPGDGTPRIRSYVPSSNAVICERGMYASADRICSRVSGSELFWKFRFTTYCVSGGSVLNESYCACVGQHLVYIITYIT